MLLIGLQAMLWFGDHGLIQLWRMERTLQQQQTANQGLVERNRRLQAEVVDLKRGTDALEERARSQLGMIKPGETFYQVIKKNDGASP